MRNSNLVLQLLRLLLQQRQGQGRFPRQGALFGRAPRGVRLRRRRGPLRSLLRLILIVIALVLVVRACHTRSEQETQPATTSSEASRSKATWL